MSFGEPFRRGDHICAFYDTPEEQATMAARFIAEGLRARERCLFGGYSHEDLARFRARLRLEGIDAAAEEARGALLLLTKEEAHLVDGHFDSERMLKMLSAAVETALDDGYTAFRSCGDMTWLLDRAPGSSQVVEYEALVTELFRTARGLGMCQYDRRRLPVEVLDHALATHPSVVIDDRYVLNRFSTPAALAASRQPQPADVDWKLAELRRHP